jgi:hypothetical protein
VSSSRARLSLAGTWAFWPELGRSVATDPLDPAFVALDERSRALGPPRDILVPGVWQAQFDDLRWFSGCAWYERSFAIPAEWKWRRVRLCFGAVDYLCTAWVNGRRAGRHEGGYLPFSFDISDMLRFGDSNAVTLLVLDPGPGDQSPVAFAEIPHGKQSWYGPLGGPWQRVFVEATGASFVEGALIRADPATGAVVASVRVDGGPEQEVGASATVTSPNGTHTWSSGSSEVFAGAGAQSFEVEVGGVELWSPESPRLYRLGLTLETEGRVVDRWSDEFGFRTIAAEGRHLLLNGEPLYLLGALDQDYYLGSICTPPSEDVLRRQLLRARELGLNCLRCHIKVPDPRYLYWADRLGMLVWAELPNWESLTPAAAERARTTFEGLVERDFNHPSIIIWTIANESWGLDLAGDGEHRRWLKETFRWAKELDPTRLVVDNSPCAPNFHLASDLNDFHLYRAFPEGLAQWKAWTASWVADPALSYSPHGDADPGGEPQILSEFGNWGLPDVSELVDEDGDEPWWFATGEGWSGGVARPEGIRERFEDWDLERVFGSWPSFIAQSQEHQFEGMRASIEDLRSHPEIGGYVITELTDVHWECNGLLDMARNPKSYHHRFPEINAPDIVWARPRHRRYRSGELIELDVSLSHYSGRDLAGCEVTWSMELPGASVELPGASGTFPFLCPERGAVLEAGRIEHLVPELEQPVQTAVEVVLRDRHGRRAARSTTELLLFPAYEPRLEAAPSKTKSSRGDPGVVVTESWNNELADHLRAGGRALIVANHETALPAGKTLSLRARAGTPWEGDWAQGMGWLRPEVHEGLGVGPRVSSLFSGLAPELVVLGYEPEAATDVLAGLYLGWIREVVATAGAFRAGEGAGIVCTWPLLGSYGRDPLATVLLDRLTELAARPGFRPRTTFAPAT